MEQQGVYERIKDKVRQLREESQDQFFTEYLVKLDGRLIQEKYQLELLEMELDRNCQIYRQRLAAVEAAVRNEAAQGQHLQEKVRNLSDINMRENQTVPSVDVQENEAVSAVGTQENITVPIVNIQENQIVPTMNMQREARTVWI